MIKWLKGKQDDAPQHTPDPEPAGGEVSQGPNSFDDAETSTGGADSVYGTPDATPSEALGERGLETPPTPASS